MNNCTNTQDVSAESLLGQAADEFSERLNRGETPNIEEFAGRYPQVADLIRQVFPALSVLKVSPNSESEPDPRIVESTGEKCLGDYRIVREIGRGGMGVVYEAEQISLGRKVALKVLPFAAMLDKKQLQRFQNEARAAASLRHPNIVQIHFVGCERAVHFYAMDYIEGQTLAELIRHLRQLEGFEGDAPEDAGKAVSDLADSLASGRFDPPRASPDPDAPTAAYTHARTPGTTAETAREPQAAISTERSTKSPAYFRSIAELGVQVAEALDHAHQNGVIHRDVKPSNLILDNSGKPWITDFGLARIETDATLTVSGDLLGTIRYMSPEQALAKRIVVDHRTDIYSLGATLYELLTLQPVFRGQDRQELLRQVAFDEPKTPRKLNKAIPAELETIVTKAMAKKPAERYDTAQELADDLRRFLDDRPIRARRPSAIVRLAKWTRRHRSLVLMLTSSTLTVLLIALAALGVSNSQIRVMLDQRNKAVADLQWAAYRHNVALAQREWFGNEIEAAEKALERCPQAYRGWEWQYVKNLLHLDAYTFHSHEGEALGMAFSPDSRHIALASSDGYVRVWDVRTKEALFAAHLPANESTDYVSGQLHGNHLAFSPDGRRIAVGCLDGTLALLDAQTGMVVEKIPAHSGFTSCVGFSPDGRKLVTCSRQGTIKVWDAKDLGREPLTLNPKYRGPVTTLFSPNGTQVVSTHASGKVLLWNAETGEIVREFERSHRGRVYTACFHPNGKRFVTGGWDGTLKIWDVNRAAPLATFSGHTSFVRSVAFSPDGKWIASTSEDKSARIWNADTGRTVEILRGHRGFVLGIEFSRDGRFLCTSGEDGTIKLWHAPDSDRPLRVHHGPNRGSASFDPNNHRIGIKFGPHLEIRDTATSKQLIALSPPKGFPGDVGMFAFSSNGKLFAIGTLKGQVHVCDSSTGKELTNFRADSGSVFALCFTANAGHIISGGSDATIRVSDAGTGGEVFTIQATDTVYGVAADPLGRLLAWVSMDGKLTVAEATAGRPRLVLPRSVPPLDPLFVRGGRYFWTFRDTLAFSPDGRRIAAAGGPGMADPGDVAVWDVRTGERLLDLRGHSAMVNCVAFSPDGTRIATGSNDHTIKLWTADKGEEVFTIRDHNSGVLTLDYSPDGNRLLSGSIDCSVRIFDATPMPKVNTASNN